ncbi:MULTISPECIES: GNAT family N-acetyltransferase [unclassified Ensifer]|uniref:GNAT family N-acetyltransferase n=1 Tax=unclassified Ensifer TaxID=2633371 RepID=UPI00081394B5|nr:MULTISPECIES: GNAT family N-acetyltransferase [unclassified Ensifer]OCP19682.1 acetyltransferase [Ensifer sp. LC54]OCP19713.1 acetyltransferase [Ensifer sp. LC384]
MNYYGTEKQQRLQRQCDEAQSMIAATPGLVQAGRFFSVDDIDRIDWAFVEDRLASDGVFGFRMMPTTRIDEIREKLGSSYRMDLWSVFSADRDTAIAACTSILETDLPDGLTRVDLTDHSEEEAIRLIQTCMAENGIAPFSGAMLIGQVVPAATLAFADADGHINATAHANMAFNSHSRHRGTAWVGLITVAALARGRGLGRSINAMAIMAAVERLGANAVVEFVHADNTVSRRMIESCGLRVDPTLVCGLAVPTVDARFTT